MDVSPTASKRRLVPSPTSATRRPKRRRKNSRWGTSPSDVLDSVADEDDLRSTTYVDEFVRMLRESTDRACLPLCCKVLQTLSHFVVDPVVNWKRQAGHLLGENNGDDHEADKDDGDTSESEEEGSDMSDEEQSQFFVYEDIESCVAAIETNPVLALLDLTKEEDRLKTKLADIEALATKATGLLCRITEDKGELSKSADEVLAGLKLIMAATQSPDHAVFNVDPIGRSGSPLTRDLLKGAIDTRSWLMDVKHVELIRERSAFIQELSARLTQLPQLVNLPQIVNNSDIVTKREEAETKIQKMSDCLSEHAALFEKYNAEIGQGQKMENSLMSGETASEALKELGKCSVISLVEEKIAVRLDVLDWNERAKLILESNGTSIEYTELESLNSLLQSILSGRTRTRMQMLQDVQANEEVESEVKSFASMDVKSICGPLVERVSSLYSRTHKWKERADSTISTLRLHGNSAVGTTLMAPRPPAMVVFSRINDLVEEYKSMQIEVPGYTAILQRVEEDANKWSMGLHTTIIDTDISLEQCHSFLETERDRRPRGIIMDPTRHVFDSLLDMLVWHKRVKDGIKLAVEELEASRQDDSSSSAVEIYSMLLANRMYPLLVEGTDAVEVFADTRGASGQFKAKSQRCVEVLEKSFHIRRSARALSREKLESHSLGSSIFSRMVRTEVDIAEGSPLLLMLWVQWHLFVAEFVSQCSESSDDESEGDNSTSTIIRSLTEARELRAQQPLFSDTESGISSDVILLLKTKTTELMGLERVIEEGGQVESETYGLLSKSREMLRGGIQKPDLVRQHLVQLKESRITFKDRSLGDGGLSLNPAIERQLEHHIKIFTWLVRTLSYPLLHLDQASYSMIGVSSDGDENVRVPWDVLVSLYDRIPCEVEERVGDFALVSLRVRELYEDGKKWQDEITRNTMISIRGTGKRRAPTIPGAVSPGKSEHEQEASSKLQIEKMKQLAENNILAKVAMPREGAVNGILRNSNEFEVQLFNFLGEDYDGSSPDRAAFPESDSLVGKKGEFILYRLTGGPIFESLQSSMHPLSIVGENLLAETPGKAAFDWIKSAVSWIERLNDSVTTESPFADTFGNILVIPGTEGREILKEGEIFFLSIPEDLKKTLSKHGIFVSTNKQERTLRVILKKDGAHHSIGGTVIRWCPILFDCLRADVGRLDEWEKDLTRILAKFNSFFSETRNHPKNDEKDLYQWYCFREQVAELLNEGKESLVVSPQKGLVDSFQKLLSSIQNYLTKHSKPESDRSFANKWFAQSTSLLDDRFLLLESLLYRKTIFDSQKAATAIELASPAQSERTFRDTCRSYIEKSLSKALKVVGMAFLLKINNLGELESCCAIKAWEVENEMFENFQEELGLSRVSEEYRNKARGLRCSLEDRNNSSLCLRVLIGDIDAAALVDMSSEQLASHKAKFERARAEQAARNFALLTPEFKDENSADVKNSGDAEKVKEPETSMTNVAGLASALKSGNEAGGISSANINVAGVSQDSDSPQSLSAERKSDLPQIVDRQEGSPAALKALMRFAPRSSRPPPPPSLVRSFQSPSEPAPSAASWKDRGTRVVDSSGGDRFRIEIVNPRLAFNAAFYLEDESQAGVNNFLPAMLAEKGRLKIHEFSRFLSDKLAGGRWVAIPLRLTTISDQDAKEYKKFYKEYEVKERIAMFSVNGQNSKVFLVTPKFHGAVKRTGLVSLPNKTSTYAIVLTKEVSVLMD